MKSRRLLDTRPGAGRYDAELAAQASWNPGAAAGFKRRQNSNCAIQIGVGRKPARLPL